MRHFYLYLIKEEFANHYFGRENKLYRLFQSYIESSCDTDRSDTLKLQIDYVSKPIPITYLDELILMYLAKEIDYEHVSPFHHYHLRHNRGKATLVLKSENIEITALGSVEAETVFFEVLRKFSACFLAMDFQNEQYGWLSPIKQRKFV